MVRLTSWPTIWRICLRGLTVEGCLRLQGERILATRGAELHYVPMTLPQKILHAIVDPNIAYLLFIVGIAALVAEFHQPGAILPGTTGAICLILACVAFGSPSVNWGGLALIVLAVVLFILDIKVAGYRLTSGEAIALVLGSLMIFSPFASPSPALPRLTVSRPLIAVVTASLTAFFLFALSAGISAQRAKVISGIGNPSACLGRPKGAIPGGASPYLITQNNAPISVDFLTTGR